MENGEFILVLVEVEQALSCKDNSLALYLIRQAITSLKEQEK